MAKQKTSIELPYDEEISDYLATQTTFGKFIGVSGRQVRNLRDEGVIFEEAKGIPLIANIRRYYVHKLGTAASDVPDGQDYDELNKKEDYRRKLRDNNIAEGLLVKKEDFVFHFRRWSKQVKREHESIEGQIGESMIECPKCQTTMKIDGRGIQRIKKTVTRILNHLHQLHHDVENTKSEPLKK